MKKSTKKLKTSQRKAVKRTRTKAPITKKKFIEQLKGRNPLWKLTPRQVKYRRNRFELGMSQYNAARAAGYSEAQSRSGAHRTDALVKVGIVDELERAGATDKVIAQELFDIAKYATKRSRCTVEVHQEDGELVVDDHAAEDVPDRGLRLAALETIAKIKKHISSAPLIPQTGFTKMTIVVEKEPEPKPETSDARSRPGNNPDTKTKLRVSTTDQP